MTPKKKLAHVAAAAATASLVWPAFVEQQGNIYLADCAPSKRRPPNDGLDNTGREAFHNHVHVLEVLAHSKNVWDGRRKRFRRSHPEFKSADVIGRVCAEAWFAKLRRDFPNQHFRVYYSAGDDPTVRFHRIYPSEPVWFDASGSSVPSNVVVFDSRLSGRGE